MQESVEVSRRESGDGKVRIQELLLRFQVRLCLAGP